MSDKAKKEGFKISTQTITFAYIVLICIGYFTKNLYYSQFDIDIEEYLNFEEFLFIYLPLGSIFLTIILSLTAFLSGIYGLGYLFFNKNILFNISQSEQTKQVDKQEKKNQSSHTKKYKTFKLTLFIVLFSAPLLFIAYFAIFNRDIPWNLFSIGAISWGAILFILFLFSYSSKAPEDKTTWLLVSHMILFISIVFCDSQYSKAEKVLNGKPIKEVKFVINNKTIASNQTTLYIGETKDYLFMRDIKTNTNLIFQKKEIPLLKLTEIKETEPEKSE